MKKILSFAAILCLSTLFVSAQSVLTNASLIEMKKAGLSDALIHAKINEGEANFDTSLDAILELKKLDFSDETIELMILKNSESQPDAVQNNDGGFAGIFPESIQETGGKLLVNNKFYIEKGGNLQVYLPFAGKDFMSITPKSRTNAKLLGKIAGAVGTGAAAVALGSGNLNVMSGALDVMSKAQAVEWGADALQQIENLPISQNAKKIAGSQMQVLDWDYTDEGYVLTTQLDKKRYSVVLSNALIFGEIKLE